MIGASTARAAWCVLLADASGLRQHSFSARPARRTSPPRNRDPYRSRRKARTHRFTSIYRDRSAGGCWSLVGWAVNVGISRALYVLLPDLGMPLTFNLHSDWRIITFVAAIAIAVTLICGMYPVRQSLRISQREALHEGSLTVAGSSRKRIGQRILLGVQLGICFIVLACCGLLTRSAFNIFNRPTGFDRTNTLTAIVDLSRAGYSDDRARLFLSNATRSPAQLTGRCLSNTDLASPHGGLGLRQHARLQHPRLCSQLKVKILRWSPTSMALTSSAPWAFNFSRAAILLHPIMTMPPRWR